MTKTILVLTGLICLLALPLSAQVNDTYIIPAAAKAGGDVGTNWNTELYLFNPQRHQLKVAVVFLPSGIDQALEVAVTMPPNSTFATVDALGELFQVAGTGSLLVATFPEDNPTVPDRVIDRAFVVASKTFNKVPGGTYGQAIPGTWSGLFDIDADPYAVTALAPGVQNWGTRGVNGFRTNVGAVNLGRGSVTMRVYIYDAEGREVRNIPFTLPPMGHMQDALPQALNIGSLEFVVEDDYYANDPNDYAIVFPYASVVDNRTGDPIYLNPTLLATTSVLFPESSRTAAMAAEAQASPGKKLTTAVARRATEMSKSLGEVKLALDADGRLTVAK